MSISQPLKAPRVLQEAMRQSSRRRHILDMDDFSRDELNLVLQTAGAMKEVLCRDIKKVPTLRGKVIFNLFYEPSTRTRVSFEAGMTELGGHAINLDWRATNFTLSKISFETRYLCRNAALIMARLKENSELLEMLLKL